MNARFEVNQSTSLVLLHMDGEVIPFEQEWVETLGSAPAADGFEYLRMTLLGMEHWTAEQRSLLVKHVESIYHAARQYVSGT